MSFLNNNISVFFVPIYLKHVASFFIAYTIATSSCNHKGGVPVGFLCIIPANGGGGRFGLVFSGSSSGGISSFATAVSSCDSLPKVGTTKCDLFCFHEDCSGSMGGSLIRPNLLNRASVSKNPQ